MVVVSKEIVAKIKRLKKKDFLNRTLRLDVVTECDTEMRVRAQCKQTNKQNLGINLPRVAE